MAVQAMVQQWCLLRAGFRCPSLQWWWCSKHPEVERQRRGLPSQRGHRFSSLPSLLYRSQALRVWTWEPNKILWNQYFGKLAIGSWNSFVRLRHCRGLGSSNKSKTVDSYYWFYVCQQKSFLPGPLHQGSLRSCSTTLSWWRIFFNLMASWTMAELPCYGQPFYAGASETWLMTAWWRCWWNWSWEVTRTKWMQRTCIISASALLVSGTLLVSCCVLAPAGQHLTQITWTSTTS